MRAPTTPPTAVLTLVVATLLASACDKSQPSVDTGSSPASSLPSPSAAVSESPAASAAPVASTPAPADPVQLLAFQFTSDVKGKEPVDDLQAAEPNMRVWAHLKVRSRAPGARTLHLVFKVNGEARTTMDLQIEQSWSYRTWAYNTLRKTDKTGEVTVTVTDDTGAVLVDKAVPIRAKAIKKR